MDDGIQRELGNLEARVEGLEKTIGTMSDDVKAILKRLNQASGLAALI